MTMFDVAGWIAVTSVIFIALSTSGSQSLDAAAQPARTVAEVPSASLPRTDTRSGTLERTPPKGRDLYLPVLVREAESRGLPPAIADAVMAVESGYDPNRIGGVGEVGLMQVRPQTAAILGHKGSVAELFEPEVNIRYGVAYLAEAWSLAKGDLCRTLMKYRAGHGEERMTPRSVDYCGRARAHLAAIGSPLASASGPTGAGSVPADAAIDPPSPVEQARRLAIAEARRRAWTDYVARVRDIEARTASGMVAR